MLKKPTKQGRGNIVLEAISSQEKIEILITFERVQPIRRFENQLAITLALIGLLITKGEVLYEAATVSRQVCYEFVKRSVPLFGAASSFAFS